MSEQKSGRRRGRLVAAIVGVFTIVTLGVLLVVGHIVTGDKVPTGTTVAGVDIGGLTEPEAQQKLRDELPGADGYAAVVTIDGTPHRLSAADSGLAISLADTASRADAGSTWNPIEMVRRLTGDGGTIEPVYVADEAALTTAVQALSREVTTKPREPRVRLTSDGTLVTRKPQSGRELDAAATAQALARAHLARNPQDGATPVTAAAVTTTVPTDISAEEYEASLKSDVEPALSAPVTLKTPRGPLTLDIESLAPALSVARVADGFEVRYDAKTARGIVDDLLSDETAREPQDATVRLENGAPVIVPGRSGIAINTQAVLKRLPAAIQATGQGRTIKVGNSTVAPDTTTAEARALGIKEEVSYFYTNFPYAEYRNINQSRAAELINGTVLEPGEIFSFNDTVGERTEANGFVAGTIIADGVFREELGGGVSQVVTTLYNASHLAGLKDIEHKPHSFYIDRYPAGREATVAWPTVDLKFQNNTEHGILIEAWVDESTPSSDGQMNVRLWGTPTWDITSDISEPYNYTSPTTVTLDDPECISMSGVSGFDVDITRTFRSLTSGEVLKTEVDTATYVPGNTVICE